MKKLINSEDLFTNDKFKAIAELLEIDSEMHIEKLTISLEVGEAAKVSVTYCPVDKE